MAAPIPCHEPIIFTAGDTVQWTISFSDYTSADWTLTYYFQPIGVGPITTAVATADGLNFAITIPSTTTAAMPAGVYNWQAKVSSASQTFTIREGQSTVQPNLSIESDNRSQVKRILDALNAAIEGTASSLILDSVVEGTALRRMPIEQRLMLQNKYMGMYQQELAADRIAAGKGTGRNIFARFSPNNLGWPYRNAIRGATPDNL